jgi:N-acetylglutamate synthase/N-acetylornithine aminotransferase
VITGMPAGAVVHVMRVDVVGASRVFGCGLSSDDVRINGEYAT